MESTFTFRVDSDLKRAFDLAAKGQDRTGAQLLRDFMREYSRKHAQADLIPVTVAPRRKPAAPPVSRTATPEELAEERSRIRAAQTTKRGPGR